MSRAGNFQSPPPPPSYHESGASWSYGTNDQDLDQDSRESAPLIQPRREQEAKLKVGALVYARVVVYIVAIILISSVSIAFYKAVPQESLCERIRQDTRERWELEKRHHEEEVLGWKDEIESYRRQESGLIERLGGLLDEIQEKGEELKDLERRARQVGEDIEGALEQSRRRVREAEEMENAALQRMREAEEMKNTALQRMREFEKQLREEREKYAKMGIYWVDAKPAEWCLGHDAIEYTARLANVRPNMDPVKACHSTPLILHGKTYESPKYCDVLSEGDVYGRWVVSGEYKCQTYWKSKPSNKGCTTPGSGVRRFEGSLGGIHDGQDWENLCYTTPMDIMKQHFDRPMMCLNSRLSGVRGIWDVRDPRCG